MANYSSFSVFLDYKVAQGLCWSMAIISVPCNIFIILRFILLNYRYSKILGTKAFISFHQSRYSISHNPSIFLLFNLTLGDFFSGLYLLTLAIGDGINTENYQHLRKFRPNSTIRNDWIISPACTMARMFSQTAVLISILMTFMVALDRFILVVFPRSRYKITIKKARIIATVCWLLAAILATAVGRLSSLEAAKLSAPYDIFSQLCIMELSTNIFVSAIAYSETFLGFGLHVTSMILYIIIYRKLKQSKRNFHTKTSNRTEKRISIILSTIVFTNVFTYLSMTLFSSLSLIIPGYTVSDTELFPCSVMLFYVNAVINPILLMSLSAKIGSSGRQIGQSNYSNTSNGRSKRI